MGFSHSALQLSVLTMVLHCTFMIIHKNRQQQVQAENSRPHLVDCINPVLEAVTLPVCQNFVWENWQLRAFIPIRSCRTSYAYENVARVLIEKRSLLFQVCVMKPDDCWYYCICL